MPSPSMEFHHTIYIQNGRTCLKINELYLDLGGVCLQYTIFRMVFTVIVYIVSVCLCRSNQKTKRL